MDGGMTKSIIIATIFLAACLLLSWHQTSRHEADIEQAWSDGYTQYQIDRYIPKPDHKAPDSRLKGKVSG
jgi:preprotein translocase subunit SecG